MIRGPQKILKIEALLRGESRGSPASLWITVLGLEHEPFTVLAIGLVIGNRTDIVWARAPKRFLRRRGWAVTKKQPISIGFPLDSLHETSAASSDRLADPEIGVESVIVSLSSGIEMRQRIYEIARESKPTRRFLPRFGGDQHKT